MVMTDIESEELPAGDRQMKEEVEGVPGFLVRMVVDLLARWKAQDGRRKDDSGHFCEFLLLQLKI